MVARFAGTLHPRLLSGRSEVQANMAFSFFHLPSPFPLLHFLQICSLFSIFLFQYCSLPLSHLSPSTTRCLLVSPYIPYSLPLFFSPFPLLSLFFSPSLPPLFLPRSLSFQHDCCRPGSPSPLLWLKPLCIFHFPLELSGGAALAWTSLNIMEFAVIAGIPKLNKHAICNSSLQIFIGT